MLVTRLLRTHWKLLLIGVAVLLNVVFVTVLVGGAAALLPEGEYTQSLEELSQTSPTFEALGKFFVRLAEDRGAVFAFEVLKRAPLPPGVDIHLLGHLVGDELYKQQGLDGMKFCTPDFRNACSHTVVIGALLEDGMAVFDQVHEVCKGAPGGRGAYTMCFHGFGHGVLAYAEYDVPEALQLCELVGTEAYNNREYAECAGGLTMEMISGVHDRDLWQKKKVIYMPDDDPLALCKNEAFTDEARDMCYGYITPQLFMAAGADLGNPDPATFPDAFRFCNQLSVEDARARAACFGGFGKEFVVLAQDRDIRKTADMTDAQLTRVHEWCAYAGDSDGRSVCERHALGSLYWGGENDPDVSIRFCTTMSGMNAVQECVATLTSHVGYYVSDPEYRAQFCAALPESLTSQCEEDLRGA